MRALRAALPLVAGLLLAAPSATAAPDDPWVAYTANSVVTKQGQPSAVILRFDPASGGLTEVSRNGAQGTLFRRPYDLAMSPDDGSLYVVDMGEFATPSRRTPDGRVIRVDPATGAQTLVAEGGGLVDPAGLTVAPDGTIYVLENVGVNGVPAVLRVDPASGSQTVVSSRPGGLLCYPFGIALDARGGLVVTDFGSFRTLLSCLRPYGSVVRIDPGSGAQSLLSSNGLSLGNLFLNPFGVAVGADGQVLVVNQRGAEGAIARINPLSGLQTALTPNNASDRLVTPQRLAFAPDGRLVVSDFALDDEEGGLVGVTLPGGAQQVLRRGRDLFNNPLGVAVVVNRAPRAALVVSSNRVAGGEQIRFSATGSSDPEGLPMRYDWDLDGDGLFELRDTSGAQATRAFASSTTFTPRVRASDPHGAQTVASLAEPVVVDAIPPVLSRFRSSPKRLAARGKRSPTRRRLAKALRFEFRASESATVRIGLQRALAGRRSRGRCVAPRRKLRRAKRCTRYRELTTLRRAVRPGPARIRFAGKIRGRAPRAGRYRAVAVATDDVGNRSKARRAGFKAVRR